jgi:hypothetical protein
MTIVRTATKADEEGLIKLLRLMHAESGMFPLDDGEMRNTFARAFNREGGIIGVIGEPDDIRAGVFLLVSRFWYTKQFHFEDLFNFVHPDHRRTDYADSLIKFSRACSDKSGVPVILGVLTNKQVEAKVRLYRRRLGLPVGAVFAYNANWVSDNPSMDIWKIHGKKLPMAQGTTTVQ